MKGLKLKWDVKCHDMLIAQCWHGTINVRSLVCMAVVFVGVLCGLFRLLELFGWCLFLLGWSGCCMFLFIISICFTVFSLQQNLPRLPRTDADDMGKLPNCCFTFRCEAKPFPQTPGELQCLLVLQIQRWHTLRYMKAGLQKARGYSLSLNYRGISFGQVTINKIIHLAMPHGTQSCQKEKSKCLFFLTRSLGSIWGGCNYFRR